MTVNVRLYKPHPAQSQILQSDARFKVIMAGRRFGKSLISQNTSIEYGLGKKQVAYITPTYQLGKVFFQEIISILPTEIYNKNEADLVIKFITGGTIRFFTGERLDALRGLKFHIAIIDEASFIPNLETGWMESIRPTLTDYKGKAIFISTPKGRNYFFSLYNKGINNEPDWAAFKFTTYDNPHMDPAEIDDARRQLPHSVFEQEYMANPQENADNPFGSQFIRDCIQPLSNRPPLLYAIDLAKSSDWTVIIGMDEFGQVCHFQRFQKDWMQTKAEVMRLNRVPIIIDATGVGDPIAEELQNNGLHITPFKFTSTSKQQLMLGLVYAIQNKLIGYPDGTITNELEIFEYQYTATGVRYSAPSGFHDDTVMALAMAWHHKSRNVGGGDYVFDDL